jgi:carbonic anhydrase/acetyltransferase-like protein (isoleucine patch superfamily)
MTIYSYGDLVPEIHETAYIEESSTIIGKVILGPEVSIWPTAVLRGDNEPIEIGSGSNVQEGAVLHNDPGFPLKVGANVTIGHQAMLHGCTLGDGTLIGVQAVILNGAVIGRSCLVAAGAVITEGKVFPDNSLIIGAPAKVVRTLNETEVANLEDIARDYSARAKKYKTLLRKYTPDALDLVHRLTGTDA